MSFHFHIHYKTRLGQQLAIQYWMAESKTAKQLFLNTYDGEHWLGLLQGNPGKILQYQYQVVEAGEVQSEFGTPRQLHLDSPVQQYHLRDQWKARGNKKNIFNSDAFKKVFLPRTKKPTKKSRAKKTNTAQSLKFYLNAPDIPANACVGITGNIEELGNWENPILLEEKAFPIWSITVPIAQIDLHLEYKFVLCQKETGEVINWENGDNRKTHFHFSQDTASQLILSHEEYRFSHPWWRAAGLAIPVFSLRSQKGFGIGEFADLAPLVDVSVEAGLKLIQVLPVNDTIATKTWVDSYPYAAISVFALHPLYINIPEVGKFKNKNDQKRYLQQQKKLNALAQIDFEAVLKYKFEFLNILYQENYKTVFASATYQAFFKRNKHWLIPYAAFCYLRDQYKTPDFNSWPEHQRYDPKSIEALSRKNSESYSGLAFYFFLQYHADKQLKAARDYGRSKGVALKGDLPIGIYRFSADAWVAPELYNMDEQAGAPPDDYAVLGQNWGFPTYNWTEMAKDNFGWWQQRMQQLAEYFDALRIDHILGFFRIWQIPIDQVSGTLGLFNPRLPYSKQELAQFGLTGELDQYTQPYIREYLLTSLFGKQSDWVKKTFLDQTAEQTYSFKASFKTQAQIQAYFSEKVAKKYQPLLKPVLQLASEVLLIKEPQGEGFNPRITLNTTYAYQALDDAQRNVFDRLYHDYYYIRHDDFWRSQALWKLPALLDATNMLICGEDLGMIPASVPGVMDQLNIIALEIQRMPKGNSAFGIPHQYPYFSVCSPSCHDMSTIRGWWEGDHATAQRFYNEHLQQFGEAPQNCDAQMVTTINQEHLDSPSLLAIFPIQDLIGMDEQLKRKDAFAEQINEPSNPKHYWRYRFHINVEQLIDETEWIGKLKAMVKRSGR